MEELLAVLRAAGESTRLRILALLSKSELTVSELVSILEQSQPRVSRHLKLMGEAGVLDRFQEGTVVFYRPASHGIGAEVNKALVSLIPENDDQFLADFAALSAIREERFRKTQQYFRNNAAEWDKIRSLYVAEEQVENALLEMQGRQAISSFLDVGTGTGRMLEIFAPYTRQAVGVDVSREMLNVARGNLAHKELTHCQVRLGDMYNLNVEEQSQGLVLFHQVLHFAEDPAAAIGEAARVLLPSGMLLIADFAPHTEEFLREEQAHRRLGFTDEEIITWGDAAGLSHDAIEHLDGGQLGVTLWRFTKADSRD